MGRRPNLRFRDVRERAGRPAGAAEGRAVWPGCCRRPKGAVPSAWRYERPTRLCRADVTKPVKQEAPRTSNRVKSDRASPSRGIGTGTAATLSGLRPHEVPQWPAVKLSEFRKLDHVEPPLAGLAFGDERLRPPEGLRDLGLSESG